MSIVPAVNEPLDAALSVKIASEKAPAPRLREREAQDEDDKAASASARR